MASREPISFPPNYKSFWNSDGSYWMTEGQFQLWFGDITAVQPTHTREYLFQNHNLQEFTKNYPHVWSPDLVRVYVEFNTTEGWLEIVDLEIISSYYPGAESYETGTYIGEIEAASKLKEILITKYWSHSDEDYYDDIYLDYPQHDFDYRFGAGRDDFDPAYGAEGVSS